jgi:DNA-binding CsgD family transcriptional regulator
MAHDQLRERSEALKAVSDAIASARAGVGRVVLLRGDAGVGKTALLRRAPTLAGDAFAKVDARGGVMERDLPFAFVKQLGQPPVDAASDTGDPGTRRALVLARARESMHAWAQSGPTLVLLDDLHWADLDSLAVVGFLARRLAQLPIAMIGALRPWPAAAPELADLLVHEGVARIIDVAPLSEDAAGEVLGDLAGHKPDGALVNTAFRLTRGNPLLLQEAARTLALTGALPAPTDGGDERLRRLLLLGHMAGIDRVSLACAQAVAVLGGPAPPAAVRAVARLSPEELADALDTLVAAGVVRADGAALEPAHDLLGSALYFDMAPAGRALLHARAFAYHRDRGDVAAAAPHAIVAGLSDDDALTAIARAGAVALSAGAVETGLHQFDAAVRLAEPTPSDGLLSEYADALFASGRALEALAVYRRLLTRPLGPDARADALMRAARAQAYGGRLEDALASYDALVAEAGGLEASPVGLVMERSHVVWELHGPAAALVAMGPSTPRAGELHEAARAVYALETGDLSGLPAVRRAVRTARASLARASGAAAASSFNAFLMQVSVSGTIERYDEAEEYIELGTAWLRTAGVAWATVPLRISRIGILVRRGALIETITETDDIDEELDVSPLLRPYLLSLRARALVWLGRVEEAVALCDDAERLPGAGAWFIRLSLATNRAERLLGVGRAGEAAQLYRQIASDALRFTVNEPCIVPWAAGAIESALAAGDPAHAAEVVEWLQPRLEPLPCVWPRMVALGGRAGIAAAAGDHAAAERYYLAALELPVIAPLDRARIALRYGAWLRRRNQPTRARAPLADALRTAEERGAGPLAALAAAELSAAGGRRRRPREDDSLTPQEARVARIAVTGATTREIALALHLSPRTVETHLSHVYLKLGVGSKQELRRRRAELDLETNPR